MHGVRCSGTVIDIVIDIATTTTIMTTTAVSTPLKLPHNVENGVGEVGGGVVVEVVADETQPQGAGAMQDVR